MFKSWKDFQLFQHHVQKQSRYVYSGEISDFLEAIKETLPSRSRSFPIGSVCYRSQQGHYEYVSEGNLIIMGHSPDRMKPTVEYAIEGRANPKGIPYLYLSNDRDISMMELRPHIGETISCGEFKVSRDLVLIDCYSVERTFGNVELIFNPPTDQMGISQAIWSLINDAFAKPISNSETTSDYVPTQILAELFKSEGYDGICCKSSFGSGYNYILFDLMSCEQISTTVMDVESINIKFNPCSQTVKINHNK